MIFKIYEIQPVFNQVITTKDVYTKEDSIQGGIYTGKENSIKEFQKVLAVGPSVRGIEVGDYVKINPARYAQIIHKDKGKDMESNTIKDQMHVSVQIPSEVIYTKDENGIETSRTVLVIYDNDVHFVVKKGEWFDENSIGLNEGLILS